MRIFLCRIFLAGIRLYFKSVHLVNDNRFFRYIKQCFRYSYLRYFGVEAEFNNFKLVGLPIIHKAKNSRIILGKGVTLISNCRGNVAGINHRVILATLAEGAVIHLDGCGVSGASICAVKSVKIGKNSGLGANVCVYDTDFHPIGSAWSRQSSILDAKAEPVNIGENVWVAANAIILKGVSIGNGAVIGAGSVVGTDIAAKTLVKGNPAQTIRSLNE